MKKKQVLWTLSLSFSLILGACRTAPPAPSTVTQVNPNVVFTAAAQTAQAMMTEMAAITPTSAPATDTPPPPTETPAPTTIPLTATATLAPATSGPSADRAEFVSDITIPDGTDFAPGQTFEKTWQIQNAGTTTWSTDYAFVFISGAQMSAPASVPVPNEVAPGQTVNILVSMTAPSDPGNYRGFWKMKNSNGQLFETSVYVDIDVVGSGTPSAQGTPNATTSANATSTTASSSNGVTNASLSVDNATFSGDCPHSFVFTGQVTLGKAAAVTYQLEADTGFDINLPEPVTVSLDAGTRALIPISLEFTNSVSGTARLHITEPNTVNSSGVNFTLTCQ